ncbi:MAG: hypothetical protein EA400_11680 [Chromatiaceae bacterium]|nr:MAG: hypothetical protein EA400_11680 [Chromatiaceae bacterium]
MPHRTSDSNPRDANPGNPTGGVDAVDHARPNPAAHRPWLTRHKRAVLYFILAIGVLFVLLIAAPALVPAGTPSIPGWIWLTILGLLGLPVLVWFVVLFSKPIPSGTTGPNLELETLKRDWMIFAYGFMLFAMLSAIIPFLLPHPNSADAAKKAECRPIWILQGCVDDSNSNSVTTCGAPKRQGTAQADTNTLPRQMWLINIGGHVKPCQSSAVDGSNTGAQGNASSTTPAEPGADTPAEAREANSAPSGSSGDATTSAGGPANNQRSANSRTPDSTAGDHSSAETNSRVKITGGLVVPLYLVIVALIGGAISLTRRIPEYQKQSEEGYVAQPGKPFLTPSLLREYLVFQIVQFMSAPFLATVAFFLIKPPDVATTVLLAFGAGFASEPILLWVRAAIEKLEPSPSLLGGSGSVFGQVIRGEQEPVKEARVRVVGRTEEAITDPDGWFVINGLPPGYFALEVVPQPPDTATSMAGVRVEARQANRVTTLMLPDQTPVSTDAPGGPSEGGAASETVSGPNRSD